MTGAGSATLLLGLEDSFTGTVSGNYVHMGRNPSVDDLSLQNQLTRMVEAGQIQSVESVAGNLEGALSVSGVINQATHGTIEEMVFNDGGQGFASGRAQSAEVIAGSEYLDTSGTATLYRALKGVIPTDYEISFTQGGMVEYSLTLLYATEDDAVAKPASADITTPQGGGDAAGHSFALDIDGTDISDLQEATLSYSNLYSYRRGPPREPIQATLARPEASLDATAIWDGPDRHLEIAYGTAGATTPSDRLDSVSGEVDVTVDGTQVTTHTLPKLTVADYSWAALINDGEQDTTEPVSFNVDGQVSVA
jgi:hypothetical protein